MNCWKVLRDMTTTTQLEMVNVTVQKCCVLDNQQPSPFKMGKVQRPGDIPRRIQANPKREAMQINALKIWSFLNGNIQQFIDFLGFKWYSLCKQNTEVAMKEITVELIERFSEKWEQNKENGCWEWTASLVNGYGQIKVPGKREQYRANRLSYLIHYGEIPEGMKVCHTCDNPLCVKPSHLFLGTQKDNLVDMASKNRATMHNAKLNEDKVFAIHKMSQEGISQGDIGKSFGVRQSTIWKILQGQRWKLVFARVKNGEQFAAVSENK